MLGIVLDLGELAVDEYHAKPGQNLYQQKQQLLK